VGFFFFFTLGLENSMWKNLLILSIKPNPKPFIHRKGTDRHNTVSYINASPCYLRREVTNCSVVAQLYPGKEMVLQATDHHLLVAEVPGMHSICLMGTRRRNPSAVPLRSSCLGTKPAFRAMWQYWLWKPLLVSFSPQAGSQITK